MTSRSNPLRALIFDVDGTLAETEEVHRQSFNQAFAEFGLPWIWDQPLYRRLLAIAGGRERMAEFAREIDDVEPPFADIHRRKTEIYTSRVAGGTLPFRPGIIPLIEQARGGGVRLAIATTTSRANVEALLAERLGWFDVVATAEDAPAKKPDPMVYRLVLERLGLPPEDCLALEDSTNGVKAARAAGLCVLVSESIYTKGDDFPGALGVFDDFGDMPLDRISALRHRA